MSLLEGVLPRSLQGKATQGSSASSRRSPAAPPFEPPINLPSEPAPHKLQIADILPPLPQALLDDCRPPARPLAISRPKHEVKVILEEKEDDSPPSLAEAGELQGASNLASPSQSSSSLPHAKGITSEGYPSQAASISSPTAAEVSGSIGGSASPSRTSTSLSPKGLLTSQPTSPSSPSLPLWQDTCSRCGTSLATQQRFCNQCGARVNPEVGDAITEAGFIAPTALPGRENRPDSLHSLCVAEDAAALAPWVRRLGDILKCPDTANTLLDSGRITPIACLSLTRLAEQAVLMGIDYSTLGLGWNHPIARIQYRQGRHPSINSSVSRLRAERSRTRLENTLSAISRGDVDCHTAFTNVMLTELGLSLDSPVRQSATFEGSASAIEAELLLPLRALNEGQHCMKRTYSGEPVPAAAIAEVVESMTKAVLSRRDGFAEWRYGNPVGMEQLRGLSQVQAEIWRTPTSMQHKSGHRTHEDAEGELGFFWATKIGGPSHGFDFEAQCHLPLLANARHKVVLTSDPGWPHYPAGRAHFRLLWSAALDGSASIVSEPRLWLEAVNVDFSASETVHQECFVPATLRHCIAKADAMDVPLLIDPRLTQVLLAVATEWGSGGAVGQIHERLCLRPSNGVCEASDFLSQRHDWVQLQEEVTEPLFRALYVPPGYKPWTQAGPPQGGSPGQDPVKLAMQAGSKPGSPAATAPTHASPSSPTSVVTPTTGSFTWSAAASTH